MAAGGMSVGEGGELNIFWGAEMPTKFYMSQKLFGMNLN